MLRQGLAVQHVAPLAIFARLPVRGLERLPLIYASAATVATSSETATARPTVLGNFMGGSFAARARHGGSAQ
jgi:hypothetical protein